MKPGEFLEPGHPLGVCEVVGVLAAEHVNPRPLFKVVFIELMDFSARNCIADSGRIPSRISVRASCPMDLRLFPVDSQTCELQVDSCE